MDWLPRVIESIKKQTIKPSKIILVDNSSTDGSQEYAMEQGCTIVDYDKSEFNYSYALNIGIKDTSQNEILILSAHCEILTPNSVEKLIEIRHQYNAAGVYGRQIPTVNSNPVDTRDLITVFGRERIVFKEYPFFHNAFSLIDRNIWKDIPFSTSTNGIEDRYWANDIVSKGYSYLYDPSFVIHHHYTINGNTWKGLG